MCLFSVEQMKAADGGAGITKFWIKSFCRLYLHLTPWFRTFQVFQFGKQEKYPEIEGTWCWEYKQAVVSVIQKAGAHCNSHAYWSDSKASFCENDIALNRLIAAQKASTFSQSKPCNYFNVCEWHVRDAAETRVQTYPWFLYAWDAGDTWNSFPLDTKACLYVFKSYIQLTHLVFILLAIVLFSQ